MISGSEINNAKDIKHLFLAARAKNLVLFLLMNLMLWEKKTKIMKGLLHN